MDFDRIEYAALTMEPRAERSLWPKTDNRSQILYFAHLEDVLPSFKPATLLPYVYSARSI